MPIRAGGRGRHNRSGIELLARSNITVLHNVKKKKRKKQKKTHKPKTKTLNQTKAFKLSAIVKEIPEG